MGYQINMRYTYDSNTNEQDETLSDARNNIVSIKKMAIVRELGYIVLIVGGKRGDIKQNSLYQVQSISLKS